MKADRRKIAKEDILRYLLEKPDAARRDLIKEIGDKDLVETGIAELKKEGLIHERNHTLRLTEGGVRRARLILDKHLAIENAVRTLPEDLRHLAAHYAEHLDLDPQQLKKLGEVFEGNVAALTDMEEGEEARLLAVLDPRPPIVARLYGVGLLPGCKLSLMARSGGVVLLAVGPGGRIVSVDRDIASHILVVRRKRT